MDHFRHILVSHKGAILLACLISLIVAAPQTYFRIDHRSDGVYQGIELLPDSPWSARAREVMDGHPNLGAIYYQDGKSDPYLFQPLGSMTVAYLGEAFGLDINNAILLSRLVLTFITSLLIYSFVFLFSGKRRVALLGTAVLLLANSALSYSGLTDLLHGKSPEDFLNISRPVNPAMIYILFFGFLSSFWLFYREKKWGWGVASAILLGLNFYNYFYSWTYFYAFGGLLVLTYLFQKKWQEAVRIGSVFLGALVVAIPYGINLYRATTHPNYLEAGARFGVILTHSPLFVGFVVIGVLALFLWLFPREDREKYLFGLTLLLTPFVTMNQQIITGKVMQVSHYHWFAHKPIALIFTLIIAFAMIDRSRFVSWGKVLSTIIIVASLGTGVFIQAASYGHGRNDGGMVAVERQKYGSVMKWLNEHAERESVILANNEGSHMTVIYTPLNVFYHRAAMYSLAATTERLEDVLFTFYRLRGVSGEDVRQVFYDDREFVSASIYGMHYRELDGSYSTIPDEKLDEIIARYDDTLTTPTATWFKKMLAKYDVRYVVWDKRADPSWRLNQLSFLNEVAVLGDLAIYRFDK